MFFVNILNGYHKKGYHFETYEWNSLANELNEIEFSTGL